MRHRNILILAFALLLAGLIVLAGKARAHGWYPHECCHDQDCAVVEKVDMLPAIPMATGAISMVVTTKYGTAIVPASFPRRESKDGQMHACMLPDSNGNMRVLCLFMPPSM